MQRLRTPAFQAPQPSPAVALAENPAPLLLAMYRRIWETSMRDLPFVNPALAVDVVGFRRFRGDWVGVVITPWFLNLFLLPGGGELWSDRPAGERGKVAFPVGELEFIADNDAGAEIPAHQYCPLFAPVTQFATQAAAEGAALAALEALFAPPPVAETPPASAPPASAPPASAPPAAAPGVSRRAFFRRLVGGK